MLAALTAEHITTAASVVGGIALIAGTIYKVIVVSVKVGAPHLAKHLDSHFEPRFQRIEAEVTVNSGSSLKDAVRRIEHKQMEHDTKLERLDAYTHDRMHEIVNKLTVVRGLIEVFHSDEMQSLKDRGN